MTTKERLQFDFTPEALKRLDEIKAKGNFGDRAKTIRGGLRLLEWLHEEIDPSYQIIIQNKEGEEIAKFPAKLLF